MSANKAIDLSAIDPAFKRDLLARNKLAFILHSPEGTEYQCVECMTKYDDKEKLEMHLVLHNREYRFLCGLCGTGLKRKEHLDRHLLGHQEIRPYACPECGKAFKRKEHLNIHIVIHSGHKSEVCPLCHRSFYRKDHLQKHLQTHSKLLFAENSIYLEDQEIMNLKEDGEEDVKPVLDDDGDIKPMIGDDGLVVMEIQDSPILPKSSVPDHERPFACTVCHKTYKRRDHLKMHSYSHMEKDKICSECGKGFHKEEQLLHHMSVHLQPNGIRDLEEMSPIHAMLADHSEIEILPIIPAKSSKPERPHECPICHRRFKRKQHLKVHANVHHKLPTHTIWCSLCSEGFQTNEEFESHVCLAMNEQSIRDTEDTSEYATGHTQQDAKKENSYPNDITQLTINIAPHHLTNEQNLPAPLKVFVCKFCNKAFKRKDHYKIHLHIHTGVRSFFCTDCGKGFYRKDHLQKHVLIHEKQRVIRKKMLPGLLPINLLQKKREVDIQPEITITAPSKLRVPLKIKVPYQVVTASEDGGQRSVTIHPQDSEDFTT